jgi:heparan-alpha-glucosaminide N-acetyltransferase
MPPFANAISPPSSDPIAFDRILSIDIFRGSTMLLMIFVNDLSSVRGLPRWTYHAHTNEDFMTYVDMVFPAFLFILGMALPLAIERRLRKDPSLAHLIGHIVLRTVALLVFGLILANTDQGNSASMHGLNTYVWGLLALLGAMLFWAVYPRQSSYADLFRGLRLSGLVLMIAMAAIFRRTARNGSIAWINVSYPEILGLIGFTYLCISLIYLLTRRWSWAPFAWFTALTLFCCASAGKLLLFPDRSSMWIWPLSNGSMAAIAMAGVFTSSLFFGAFAARLHTPARRIAAALAFALLCSAAGLAAAPLGISKNRGTPTWSLWSIAASVAAFILLYWITDVRRRSAWAAFIRPAGSNTLLTYLVPDILYFAIAATATTWFRSHLAFGIPGVLRACVTTGLILGVAALLTRARVGLRL